MIKTTNYKGNEFELGKEYVTRVVAMCEQDDFTERRIVNKLRREEKKVKDERRDKKIKAIDVTIEWKKSSTYGYCPKLTGKVEYEDGRIENAEGYKASGWGYDKESTVFASICNDFLRYKLWEIQDNNSKEELEKIKVPYGIYFDKEFSPHFAGGVGMSCYYGIIEFLGGKLTEVANTKTVTVYRIEF